MTSPSKRTPSIARTFPVESTHGKIHRTSGVFGKRAAPVAGFKFTTLPAHEAQTFRERGRMRNTTIWFDYRIPNG
jgi:hypothetical protein